jgi:AbrB family looped-hinge helix DNA binding protein
MRVTTKGQVTIPQPIRDYLGIRPHTDVDFILSDKHVFLVKASPARGKSRYAKVVGILKNNKTTDQMMAFTRD